MEIYCELCPRRCGALRSDEKPGGICRSPLLPRIARAAPHYGEEPCIAGKNGTVPCYLSQAGMEISS